MADRDVLPVRFGTRFHDEEEAAQAVAAQRATLTTALERVRGAVELSVRDGSAPARSRRSCASWPARDERSSARGRASRTSSIATPSTPSRARVAQAA